MRITISTYGTSGDVLPYISLTFGLMERGHEVILAAPENFADLIKRHDIQYMPLYGDMDRVIHSEEGLKWIAAGDVSTFMKEMGNIFMAMKAELQRDTLAACKNSDAIICGTIMGYPSGILSEKLGIPLMFASVNPVYVGTRAFPNFIVSSRNLRIGLLNTLTWSLVFKTVYKQFHKDFSEWRMNLGLDPGLTEMFGQIPKKRIPVVHGYSHELLAKPKDWGEKISVSGTWKTPLKYRRNNPPPAELARWIEEGKPPIYIGFGSMPVVDPRRTQEMIMAVCKDAGERLILHGSWTDLGSNKDPDIYHLNQFIGLDWLFPRCNVLVHHGGVGTTHLGIEAGVPSVICSIFADNALWGERLTRLNIGRHMPFKNLRKDRLAQAIKEVQTGRVRENTARVSSKLRQEDGLKTAVDFVEANLPNAPVYNCL